MLVAQLSIEAADLVGAPDELATTYSAVSSDGRLKRFFALTLPLEESAD